MNESAITLVTVSKDQRYSDVRAGEVFSVEKVVGGDSLNFPLRYSVGKRLINYSDCCERVEPGFYAIRIGPDSNSVKKGQALRLGGDMHVTDCKGNTFKPEFSDMWRRVAVYDASGEVGDVSLTPFNTTIGPALEILCDCVGEPLIVTVAEAKQIADAIYRELGLA